MHTRQAGRAAFTLVELLVVIGIMAVLATISVAGYSAASRGMADRGVIQTTVSILRIAQQTCEIDRVPTKVLFFNQRLNDGSNEDDSTLYQGTAIAIKQAGRITINPSQVNNMLVDEFADWHQSYPMSGSANAPPMRFFRMRAREDDGADIDGCSVMVKPYVKSYPMREHMFASGLTIDVWSDKHNRTANKNKPDGAPSSYVENGNNYVWGFEGNSSGSAGALTTSSFEAGDPYGIEIARIDLPRGYIFGTSAPTSDKLTAATTKEVHFDPEDFKPKMEGTVTASAMRPSSGGVFKPKQVGSVTSTMIDDKNN